MTDFFDNYKQFYHPLLSKIKKQPRVHKKTYSAKLVNLDNIVYLTKNVYSMWSMYLELYKSLISILDHADFIIIGHDIRAYDKRPIYGTGRDIGINCTSSINLNSTQFCKIQSKLKIYTNNGIYIKFKDQDSLNLAKIIGIVK